MKIALHAGEGSAVGDVLGSAHVDTVTGDSGFQAILLQGQHVAQRIMPLGRSVRLAQSLHCTGLHNSLSSSDTK